MMGMQLWRNVAVFLDRDGTLNEDRGYVTSSEQLILFSGVPEALARLNQMGVQVILVTNQSAIGRELMTTQGLQRIHQKLADLLQVHGGHIDEVYVCPHRPEEGCACRKPHVAMISQAAERFSLDLSQCFFVGDKWSDLEAAHKAGIPGVLVMSSVYSEAALQVSDRGQFPIAYVAKTFVHAVDWIERELLARH